MERKSELKVNIIGSYFNSTTGFVSHLRNLFKELYPLCDLRLETQLPPNWLQLVGDDEMKAIQKPFTTDMVSIFLGHPQSLPLVWSNNPKTVIPFVVWEGSCVPAFWIKYLTDERIKLIFVPSEHVKNAILQSTYKSDISTPGGQEYWLNKIKIIPHGVDINLFKPSDVKIRPLEEPTTFLMNKGLSLQNLPGKDRGGILQGIKAYIEEFSASDNVQMLVKLNPSYLPKGITVPQIMEHLKIDKKDNQPLLKISIDLVKYDEMPDFYNSGDVLVSPCLAEGFNIPGIEAHACGLPTIQTRFGGQIEYMKKEIDFFINHKLEENTWDKMYEGVNWAEIDLYDLKMLMRQCYENREDVKKRGELAIENAKNFTWKKTAEMVVNALENI